MRVILTRASGGRDRLAEALAGAGFQVFDCPLIRVEPVGGPPIEAADYDWVVLTSARAIDPLLARVAGPLPPVAVIGPATADALRSRGIEPSLVARRSSQEGLAEELDALLPTGARVLFAAAEGARDVLPRSLGASVVVLYRTVEIRPEVFPEGDLVLLASGSAARSFAALCLDLPCVSIGPLTTSAARAAGLRVVAEAASQDPEGVVQAARLAESRLASSPS